MEELLAPMMNPQTTSRNATLAFVLTSLAFIPYIFDTITGKSYPQRASWLIWSTLSVIVFFTQISEGATTSLWFIGAQSGFTIFVFLLSVWYGLGSYCSRFNLCMFAAAGVGLGVWYVLDSAAYALAMIILISGLGGCATIIRAYRAPGCETLSTWVILAAASVCGVASVGELVWMKLAYPVFLLSLYCAVVAAILVGRRRAKAWSEDQCAFDGDNAAPLLAGSLVCRMIDDSAATVLKPSDNRLS